MKIFCGYFYGGASEVVTNQKHNYFVKSLNILYVTLLAHFTCSLNALYNVHDKSLADYWDQGDHSPDIMKFPDGDTRHVKGCL